MPNIELSNQELVLIGDVLFPRILELHGEVSKNSNDEQTANLLNELEKLHRKLDYARLGVK